MPSEINTRGIQTELEEATQQLRDTANFIFELLYDSRMPSVEQEELLRHAIAKFDKARDLSPDVAAPADAPKEKEEKLVNKK